MTIQAIPTLYANRRFRSRVEARWAVFFDALGIEWDYEREGFALPSGPYLPDFWIEGLGWAEVKGGDFTHDENRKCRELTEMTGQPCFRLNGLPGRLFWGFEMGPDGVREIDVDLSHYAIKGEFFVDHGTNEWPKQPPSWRGEECPGVIAAKGARFEHGEKPKSIVRTNWKLVRAKKGAR